MRTTEIDRRILAIAAKQHDAFSRAQAFRAGATDRMVHRRLAAGDWLRPEPAVYTIASAPHTWLQRCKVAELSVPGAGLGGATAAAMHRLEGFGQGRPEIVVSANSNCRSQIAICHRYSGAKFTTLKGFKLTTVAQTMFDLAIDTSVWRLERALDDALADSKVTIADLDERSEFYRERRRAGLGVIEPLLAERRARVGHRPRRPSSRGCSRFWPTCRAAPASSGRRRRHGGRSNRRESTCCCPIHG